MLVLLCLLEVFYCWVVNGCWVDFLFGCKFVYWVLLLVLVVGNIIVGGIGKMLMIFWMIEYCRVCGLWVGVISCGYGVWLFIMLWWVWVE